MTNFCIAYYHSYLSTVYVQERHVLRSSNILFAFNKPQGFSRFEPATAKGFIFLWIFQAVGEGDSEIE